MVLCHCEKSHVGMYSTVRLPRLSVRTPMFYGATYSIVPTYLRNTHLGHVCFFIGDKTTFSEKHLNPFQYLWQGMLKDDRAP